MGWYQEISRRTYVTTYQSDAAMRTEVEAAAHFGFVTQAIARSGNRITVTYQRDEHAWARIQVENALSQVHATGYRIGQAQSNIERFTTEITTRFQAARTESTSPMQLEQKLLKGITDRIAARQTAIAERHSLMSAYGLLTTLRDQAARLQIVVPQANIDVQTEIKRIQAEVEQENARLRQDQSLRELQQRVVAEVQPWKKSLGDWWGAKGKLAGVENLLARASVAPFGSSPTGQGDGIAPGAETKRAQHQSRLAELEVVLQQRGVALLGVLEARDKALLAMSR